MRSFRFATGKLRILRLRMSAVMAAFRSAVIRLESVGPERAALHPSNWRFGSIRRGFHGCALGFVVTPRIGGRRAADYWFAQFTGAIMR
jgi:hypothetical protein